MLLLNKHSRPNHNQQAENHGNDARHQEIGNECHGGFVAEGEGQAGWTYGKYLDAFWRNISLQRFKETMLHAEQTCINAENGGGCP